MHILTVIANTLQGNLAVKVAVSILLGALILCNYRKFLFWVIFLPYSGIWIYSKFNPPEWMFVNSYIELFLAMLFLVHGFFEKRDRVALWLSGMAVLTLPSLFNADGHWPLSLFLFICLLGGSGIYTFFKDTMGEMLSERLVDKTVLVLLILSVLIKFYIAARLGESVIVQRGGGIIGSNHIAGIFFLLMPFVTSVWLQFFVLVILILNFSRGIYLALGIYLITYFLFVNKKTTFLVTCAAILLCGLYVAWSSSHKVVGCDGPVKMEAFVLSRARMDQGMDIQSTVSKTMHDQRFGLWIDSLKMARENHFLGTGLGSFIFELKKRGYPDEYLFSNAHSIFLNSLVEGGAPFALALAVFLAYLLILAFKTSKPAFAGLLSWVIYGLYSGSIYVCGGFATAGDYYYLMFVTAYVVYMRKTAKNA